ncbi:MAG TPA: cytochrome c oxidase assembly protein, partial [Acidimicrobiales bacterium]
MFAAAIDHPWQWRPHPEVWVLVASIIGIGIYVARVIGPKVVPAGQRPVTRRQKGWFWLAVVLLWAAADWPIHDIGERYLYSVHMLQHVLLSMVVPPLFLLATPTWLARLVVADGTRVGQAIRWLAKPVVAGLIFNAVVLFLHWPALVDLAVANGPLHYSLHLVLFASALLMWTPVCGPIPELRISLPAQMIYLFLMSVLPTIPAAWLTLADGVVYKAYDIHYRLFGISAVTDQQLAGLFMKLGVGVYLWTLIFILFFKWAMRNEEAERKGRVVTEREILTWDEV